MLQFKFKQQQKKHVKIQPHDIIVGSVQVNCYFVPENLSLFSNIEPESVQN